MTVICKSRTDTCPATCPHRQEHKKDEQCEPGYCSHKGHKVECGKPYRGEMR
jgi:hypothetical protein